jgi:CRISPR-associated protein Csh2
MSGEKWDPDVLLENYTPPRQSDVVFLWDAVNCNPNGDPLSGDEPRRDPYTDQAQVSMYRLKRYLRDQMHDDDRGILVKRPDQAGRQNPLDRPMAYRSIADEVEDATGLDPAEFVDEDDVDEVDADDSTLTKWLRAFLLAAADVRAFGAPVSVKDEDAADINGIRAALPRRITGPFQVHHAVSYNATSKLDEARKITTVFSSGSDDDEAEKEQGTFGEDYRLKYALFGANATLDERTAEETLFSRDDAAWFDDAFWRALKNQTSTHSKVGQEPRLYGRIEYADGSQVGDLRRRFEVINRDDRDDRELRSITDLYLDASGFVDVLEHDSVTDRIAAVHLVASESLDISVDGDEPTPGAGPHALVDAVRGAVGKERLDARTEI